MKRTQEFWDRFFLKLARQYSTASKDPSTKVGCVITDGGKEVISMGWNGLPPHIEDTEENLNNREYKLAHTIHAEVNAVIRLNTVLIDAMTAYIYPFTSCVRCAKKLCGVNIKRVVSVAYTPERWKSSFEDGLAYFKDKNIEVKLYPMEFLDSDRL